MTTAADVSERAREERVTRTDYTEPHRTEHNRLLRALPATSYERLWPELEPVELSARQTLWESNAPIRSVYFPRTCVLSLLILLEDDGPVEAATVGREGMAGVPVALGAA